MSFKRLALFIACLLLGIALAATAQAKTYSLLSGSGAQLHIGNGLALPVQTAVPGRVLPVPPTVFPPLLIKPAHGMLIEGTIATAMSQRITVPPNALFRNGRQATVGVWFSNPGLYAVASNLSFRWPTAPAVFSKNNGPRGAITTKPTTTQVFFGAHTGNSVRISPRVPGKRFGGPGRFALRPGKGAPTGEADSPVTVYGLNPFGPLPPPCTHTSIPTGPGPKNANCRGNLIPAWPTGVQPIGGPNGGTFMTPGAPPIMPGLGPGKFGPGSIHPLKPLGTVSVFPGATMALGVTLAATSTGFGWTTAIVTVSAMSAMGAPEKFVLSGLDARNAGGSGVLQMVAGAVSNRNVVGTNANRGWLRLVLVEWNGSIPALSPAMLVAGGGLMLLAFGYAVRRFSA